MTTTGFQPAQPRPARPHTARWIITVLVALVLGAVAGWLVLPARSDGSGATPTGADSGGFGGAHGPTTITRGVPSGYTRDEAGAATAAVNAIQVQVNAAHGMADPETVKATWIASNADEPARQALSQGRNTDGEDRTVKLPAGRTIIEYTDDRAVVEVWVASVGVGPGLGGKTVTAQTWSTQTITLTWQDDWKVSSIKTKRGPEPGQDGVAAPSLPKPAALYTFYVE